MNFVFGIWVLMEEDTNTKSSRILIKEGKYNTKSGGWLGARIKYDNDISDESDDDDIINNRRGDL